MIVSDAPKFICMQPWKVASSTLYRRFKSYDSGRYDQLHHYNTDLGKVIHKHLPLTDLERLPEARSGYPRFTFLRNPYDRLYSGFVQRGIRFERDRTAGVLSPENAAEADAVDTGFEGFLTYYADRRNDPPPGTHMQHEYVFIDNMLAVDFIGFVETFEASIAVICDALGLTQQSGDNVNVRFTGAKQKDYAAPSQSRYRYMDKYDARTIRLANQIYDQDFERLWYHPIAPEEVSSAADASPFKAGFLAKSDAVVVQKDDASLVAPDRGTRQ